MGKGSVVRELLTSDPTLYFSVSAKTRAPRPGELNGRDYHFLSVPEFETRISGGEFLEQQASFGDRSRLLLKLAAKECRSVFFHRRKTTGLAEKNFLAAAGDRKQTLDDLFSVRARLSQQALGD